MHALSECVRVFLGRDADDQVTPAADDVVALALELVGEFVRLVVRGQLDPHLPRRVVVRQLVLLPGLLGRLAHPPFSPARPPPTPALASVPPPPDPAPAEPPARP